MEKQLYKEFFETEDRHWWFRGRAAIVVDIFARFCMQKPNPNVLDIGSGTGHILLQLRKYTNQLAGVDASPEAIHYARERGVTESLTLGSFPGVALPGAYDVVLLLDVLEHLEDDAAAIREVVRLLEPGGKVLLTVPAHQFLWSGYDVYTHHKRRYSWKELRKVLEENGVEIELQTWYNAFFFLPFVLFRTVRSVVGGTETPHSDVFLPWQPLNWLFEKIFLMERLLLGRVPLPFGVSLLVVARKPTQQKD